MSFIDSLIVTAVLLGPLFVYLAIITIVETIQEKRK
jgi:hypothetical protein